MTRAARRAARGARRTGAGARAAALLLAGALAVAGCGTSAAPQLAASGAFIPEPMDDQVAGGFLVLENSGDEADILTAVTSELARSVELHETVDNAMRPVESMEVPAGGRLELTRGGSHLMLHDLSRQLKPGEKVPIQLHFEKSEPITLQVPVESATHTGR